MPQLRPPVDDPESVTESADDHPPPAAGAYPVAMIEVQRRVVIARPVDEVLEFVMDIERYQQVDTKIKPVEQVTRTPTRTEFHFHPKLGGIRMPGPTTGSSMQLTPGARIDVTLSHNPLRRLSGFHASFEITAVDDGTEVLRTLVFTFRPPLSWIVEPILRRRLPAEVEDELQQAKHYLEKRPPTSD